MDALLDKQTRFTFHDETQQTPLHLAAQYGMYEQVEALARQVASGLNERDEQGRTPLHNAVMNGHRLDCLTFLTGCVYVGQFSVIIVKMPTISQQSVASFFSNIHNIQLSVKILAVSKPLREPSSDPSGLHC